MISFVLASLAKSCDFLRPKGKGPVRACLADGKTTAEDLNAPSACGGGGGGGGSPDKQAYTCSDQQPFVIGDEAYGFAAANVNGTEHKRPRTS